MFPVTQSLATLLLLAPLADGWLGVYLDVGREEPVITEVIPGSPAALAGLQSGDVILAVDDRRTETRDALIAAIRARKAGESVKLKVQRGDETPTITVRLGEHPESGAQPAAPAEPKRVTPPPPAAGRGGSRTGPDPAAASAGCAGSPRAARRCAGCRAG